MPEKSKKTKRPTNMRQYRRRTERNLLIGVALLLVLGGGVLIGLIYDWGAALTGLLCLVPGAAVIVLLWLLFAGVEHLTRD